MKANNTSICAIATPAGRGGVGVVRASGPDALKAARQFCSFLPAQPESHKAYVGLLKDKGETIDEVVVTYFKKGHSYTGDEVVEVSCHGSDIILSRLVKMFLAEGLQLAKRGEFTYRAFLNNKIDLLQAQSVLSLIESQSEQEALVAIKQLKGELSQHIHSLKEQIELILAHIEASIDYSDIDIQTLSPIECEQKLKLTLDQVQKILSAYKRGQNLQRGVDMVFVGPPNAGKSTLVNALLGYERSIVAPSPGTTRDYIEGTLLLDGLRVQLYDTAGLRVTCDPIEQQGLEKTYQLLQQAQFKVFVFDLSKPLFKGQDADCNKKAGCDQVLDVSDQTTADRIKIDKHFDSFDALTDENQKLVSALLSCKSERRVLIGNKSDKKLWGLECFDLQVMLKLEICALQKPSMAQLKQQLQNLVQNPQTESVVLLNLRQYEMMKQIDKSLKAAHSSMLREEPSELIALDLRQALQQILKLLGQSLDKQVIDQIFSQFCIGK